MAVLVLGPVAQAQCNPDTLTMRNNDPWIGSFFYGGFSGNETLNLFFDLSVQVPIDVSRLWTTMFDQGGGRSQPADQVGNLAEVRVYMVSGSRTGLELTPGAWGLAAPNSGLPEVVGELAIRPWPAGSPIQNFKDAAGNPTTFSIAPGQYGVCLEFVPTSWGGTVQLAGQILPLLNPGKLHVVGVSPNPNTTWSDSYIAIQNDGIMQRGWQEVDASGALVPATPTRVEDSINLAIEYEHTQPGRAGHATFGVGCYDDPGLVYEMFPGGMPSIDLANTSWTLDYVADPGGGHYDVRPGGPAFDLATALQNGIDLTANRPTVSFSTRPWDDGSLVFTLPTALFGSGFPYPGGSCTEVTINSNGCVFLDRVTDIESVDGIFGSIDKFLRWPRLAPFAIDVFVDTFSELRLENPSPLGGIRVTWNRVRASPGLCSMQLEILPDGDAFFSFGPELSSGATDNRAITGFSPGRGGRGAAVDWSAITSLQTGTATVSPTLDLSGPPIVGSTIDAVIGRLPQNVGQPVGGFVSVAFAEQLPALPLGSLGLPGCQAYIDLALVAITTLLPNTGSGEWRWSWAVPATGIGVPLVMQGGVLATTSHNALGLSLTNGVCTILGN